ncbi:hypothetical protein HH310_08325 [Actinoplanes sp. TBRC 11911]|uniref:hypothetical protein n=1 Tax=Actinoplanes sp. TBRC 11911 TaxID=2729386 RepID=UPI00145DB069|nr:hypothetical protein [Actinoplanes sp. TBRC 11911]NMO51192.1 hypothetical protein [Actinoplanes sp. TBRC 11911]
MSQHRDSVLSRQSTGVRFLVHLLPSSSAPSWLGWPVAATVPETSTDWFGWRLMTGNNRELARSAFRFPAADLCRQAVRDVRSGSTRIATDVVNDRLTGRFSWRGALDGVVVAAGRRYQQEQGARHAARRFVGAVAGAEVVDAVRGLPDWHVPVSAR